MSDSADFHKIALKSSLFKGRPDLYFCYLKSEKIAHGIARIFPPVEFSGTGSLPERVLRESAYLPEAMLRYAAHELEEEEVLVDIFELLSLVRLTISQGFLEQHNGLILVEEYQGIVEKIQLGRQASPFLSLEDFEVSPFPLERQLPANQKDIKDKQKDKMVESKSQAVAFNKGQSERSEMILKILIERKRCSIKDISKLVRGCSEKTIQRELSVLIERGLVRREGERRWSIYMPSDSAENQGASR